MPVVYLPEDKRWEKIGEGLGAIGGAMYEQWKMADAYKGVSKMMKDPNITQADLPGQVYSKYGQYGQQVLKQITDQATKQAALTQQLANAHIAQTKDKYEKDLLLAQINQARAAAGLTTAKITTEAEEPALKRAQAAEAGAAATKTTATTPGAVTLQRAEATKTQNEADILAQKLKQLQGANMLTIDNMKALLSHQDFSNVPDAVKDIGLATAAKETDPAKQMEALLKPVQQYVEKTMTPSAAIEQRTEQDAAGAESALKFMQSFQQDPTKVGLLSGASAQGVLEHWGIPTGDVQAITQRIAGLQQSFSTAMSGGGYWSNGRLAAAKDVTPGINETPLFASISADETADRKIAELTVRARRFPGDQTVKDTLENWMKVKSITGTLQSSVIGRGTSSEQTVVNFGGNNVDPRTFATLVEGTKTYTSKSGRTTSGTDIINNAAAQGVSPQSFLNYFQSNM